MSNLSCGYNGTIGTIYGISAMTGTFSSGQFTPPPNQEYGMHTQMDTTENQYFTPSIEDIRVGYQCELAIPINYGRDTGWFKTKIDIDDLSRPDAIYHYQTCIIDEKIRVPYLTKEQIEAEGWKILSREVKKPPYKVDWINAQKGQYVLWINLALHDSMHMGISDKIYNVFRGQCKDINTFRYICKLLGI